MPTPRLTLGVGVVNGILYAVGVYSSSGLVAAVEAYDPATDTWTTKSPMPTPRNGLGVGVVDGILYAVGGGGNSGVVATLEAYDPVADTWTTETCMPTARVGVGAGVVNGVLYAVGGENGSGSMLATNEAFTPTPIFAYGVAGDGYSCGDYFSNGKMDASNSAEWHARRHPTDYRRRHRHQWKRNLSEAPRVFTERSSTAQTSPWASAPTESPRTLAALLGMAFSSLANR